MRPVRRQRWDQVDHPADRRRERRYGARPSSIWNLNWRIPVTGETLRKITGFKLTLTAANTDLYFDNLSVGTLQPARSLSFSYDTYNGQVDQAYIRAGAMAWVVYAYCVYMRLSQDFSPGAAAARDDQFPAHLAEQRADLTNGLFYEGYGSYQNPGYQFVPGMVPTVSTEHQIDLWFAFQRAASALPVAATNLTKTGQITSAQASSLSPPHGAASAAAASIDTNLIDEPLHCALGLDAGTLRPGRDRKHPGHQPGARRFRPLGGAVGPRLRSTTTSRCSARSLPTRISC